MGGPDRCDPAVLEIHFDAVRELLARPDTDPELAERVLRDLDVAILKKMARGAQAA
jgi:hypothetical protein